MSYHAVDAVIRAASANPGRFSNAEFRVLVTLAHHHNRRTGRCDPGSKRLAKETGYSRSNVVRVLHLLEDRGEIAPDGVVKGGKGVRQQYRLTFR